ncbi:MAG TPA: methionyl-tRNA formyltransferase [Kineosporiaceae bacterium]
MDDDGPSPGRVVLIGAVHEALPALQALLALGVRLTGVVTAPEARSGTMSGYVDLAVPLVGSDVPILRTGDVNDRACVEHIARMRPDVIVVVGWSQLVGAALLAVPPRGCVGFHASLLPHGRGRAPVNWAVIHGEHVTGNTMMLLAPGADTGPVLAQRRIPIGPHDTCADIYDAVGRAGADMLAEQLPRLLAGSARPAAQREELATHWPRRTPDMGIIDWDRPAAAVHDWIRAQTAPYPGAFTHRAGRRVMVWRSVPPRPPDPIGPAGQVLCADVGGLRVGTANGSVLVTEAGDPGGPIEPAGLWYRRQGWAVGETFDHVDPAVSAWALGLAPRPAPLLGAVR